MWRKILFTGPMLDFFSLHNAVEGSIMKCMERAVRTPFGQIFALYGSDESIYVEIVSIFNGKIQFRIYSMSSHGTAKRAQFLRNCCNL